jgi:plastocyanin
MRWLAAVPAVAALAVAALPSADTTINAQDFTYSPATVTIDVGDTVTFDNVGGLHNFAFDDGPQYPSAPTPAGDPAWPQQRTFTTPGTYAFHCEQHPVQMNGTVTVRAAQPAPAPTATPTPGGQMQAPAIRKLSMKKTFCSKRSAHCKRPGAVVRIDLTAPATVTGTLKRGKRKAGKVDFGTVAAGPRSLRFGKRLKPGRYTLKLRAGTLAPRTLKFRVRA